MFTGEEQPELVWAKPVVNLIGWERTPTRWQGEGWYRQPVEWKEVPEIKTLPPDLDFLGGAVAEVIPVRMRATTTTLDGALLVLDPDDGGTVRELQLYR